MHKNATDLCILILYHATLLSLFISSSSFLAESLEISTYCIMSSANNDSFTSFNLDIFYFLLCLISMARTYNTMLNKSGHPCLVPDLKERAFSFSTLSKLLVVGT